MARKVNVSILIDGAVIAPVSHLSISQMIDNHHFFEIRCPLLEKENVIKRLAEGSIGKDIFVEIGSGSDKDSFKSRFKGVVTNVRLSKSGFDEVVYFGYSKSIVMDDGPHAQSFLNKSLKDIVREVASRYGMDIKADPSFNGTIPYFVQYNETSYQFLSRLADTFGEWFYFNGMDYFFGKTAKAESIELFFGKDLESFSLGLTARPSKFKLLGYEYLGHQFPESSAGSVKVGGLDDYGQLIAQQSDRIFSFEPTFLFNQDIQDRSGLSRFSLRRKSGSAASFVIFEGISDNHRLSVGSIFKVKGSFYDTMKSVQKKAEYGEFRVIRLAHSVNGEGNYMNQFYAIPASLDSPMPNPHVREPICEIQQAEILENHDPEKMGRVEVQFWWQKPKGDKSPWIRVAASGAGGTHGAYFVPEKGDQVLVGFEHNNPNKPYVIGSLYHGKAKPTDSMSDPDNNKKVIKTKSGNQIFLSDEGGKEEIRIENGKNIITLSLEGSGKISIVTDGGDLELKAKNISISADEKISVDAGTDLTVSAGQKANISAGNELNMEGTAKARLAGNELKAEGTMKSDFGSSSSQTKLSGMNVTVESSAITDVKGSIIKLN